MVGDLTPAVADGRLSGRPVLVVVAPGASAEEADAVTEAIAAAGGIDAVVRLHRTRRRSEQGLRTVGTRRQPAHRHRPGDGR